MEKSSAFLKNGDLSHQVGPVLIAVNCDAILPAPTLIEFTDIKEATLPEYGNISLSSPWAE